MVLVDIKNYSFQYMISEEPALIDINLQLEAGKLYAIVGPNGGGKTTLANAIRGFVPKFHLGEEEGDIVVFDKNLKDVTLPELADKIGFVFQNPFTQMSGGKSTVFEELAFGLENLGVEKNEIIERVNKVLAETNLEGLRDKNPLELSGGQQQRVALASVLVMDQPLLIIDEPTSQLDPKSTDDIFNIINRLKARGKTIILIEHKIDQIAEFADEVIVMADGQIHLQGDPKSIFQDPKLDELNVALPEATSLSLALYQEAIDFSDVPITLDELCDQLLAFRKGQ